jgi:hypothetical protein
MCIANSSTLIASHANHLFAAEHVRSAGWTIETAKGIHQGGLTRSAWTDQGGVFPFVHAQVDTIERSDFHFFQFVDFGNVFDLDQWGTTGSHGQ